MQEELNQFKRLDVSELVEDPIGKNLIAVKWLWKNKTDAKNIDIRNKSYLVAKMDVKMTFLNGLLKKEVLLINPPGESSYVNHNILWILSRNMGWKNVIDCSVPDQMEFHGVEDRANNSRPDMSFDIPASLEFGGDSGPDLSFNKSASLKRLFSSARVNDLNDLIIKYKIPHDLYHRLPLEDFVMSELSDDAIGPLGLNKTLCKQGDWFSFAKCHALSPVYIDDNRSYMKHLKSRFFFIDRRAILDAMVRRHPNVAIDDLRHVVGSFNMDDVYGLPFYYTLLAAAEAVNPDPTPKDLAVGTPSFKIVAKAEASQKRKASTSGAASSHVSKRTRSALAQSSGSTTRPSLFVGDDDKSDDDDACVEIPLVTPLRSAILIPSSGNQGGSSIIEVRALWLMILLHRLRVSRPRPSSKPAPSFKDVFGDAIHTDFFPFYAGPYYATYPEGGVTGNYEFTHEEWDAPYRPTFGVLTKEVFKDHAICKTMVDQFPTPGEMVQV
ncbi:hypothetical protein Tco_0316455 [Tanacetum coccineum]